MHPLDILQRACDFRHAGIEEFPGIPAAVLLARMREDRPQGVTRSEPGPVFLKRLQAQASIINHTGVLLAAGRVASRGIINDRCLNPENSNSASSAPSSNCAWCKRSAAA